MHKLLTTDERNRFKYLMYDHRGDVQLNSEIAKHLAKKVESLFSKRRDFSRVQGMGVTMSLDDDVISNRGNSWGIQFSDLIDEDVKWVAIINVDKEKLVFKDVRVAPITGVETIGEPIILFFKENV